MSSITKKIDLGEYKVIIEYDEVNNYIKVSINDELDEEIEYIEIQNDEDSQENDNQINPSLN